MKILNGLTALLIAGLLVLAAAFPTAHARALPENAGAAEIGQYCAEASSVVPSIARMRDQGYSLDDYLRALAKVLKDKGYEDMDEIRRMVWTVVYVYYHPDMTGEELKDAVDLECKIALMDGTWYYSEKNPPKPIPYQHKKRGGVAI